MNGLILAVTLVCGHMLNCPVTSEKPPTPSPMARFTKTHHSILVYNDGKPVYTIPLSRFDNIEIRENVRGDWDVLKNRPARNTVIHIGDELIEIRAPGVLIHGDGTRQQRRRQKR